FCVTRLPLSSTLFPYTTLFRSAFERLGSLELGQLAKALISIGLALATFGVAATLLAPVTPIIVALSLSLGAFAAALGLLLVASRSEEHTSELQSRFDLVCRLLL